jgi:hypothetical protein
MEYLFEEYWNEAIVEESIDPIEFSKKINSTITFNQFLAC